MTQPRSRIWPTHRARSNRNRRLRAHVDVAPDGPDDNASYLEALARSLVDRGLATAQILNEGRREP